MFRCFWEHPVVLARERGSPTEVLIQRLDTFQRRDLHTELGGSALWIFDCRRGSLVDDDLGPWEDAKYGQAVDLIRPWMSGIPRWSAIFMLPPDRTVDRVRPLLALPEGACRDPPPSPSLIRLHLCV